MRAALILFLFLISISKVFGYELTGELRDSSTNSPIEFASIYINGTTIGTTSDLNGRFSLSFNMENCQIIVNHLAYQRIVFNFNSKTNNNLRLKLSPKVTQITPVSINGKNRKGKNMAYFKQLFLGVDKWGKGASIENDSVILFHVEYDDTKNTSGEITYFEAEATEPLLISLPKLGYTLQYDLAKFAEAYNQTLHLKTLTMVGYSSFKEIKPASERKQRDIKRNRLDAYYFSTMHFVRSLYSHTLEENGYMLYQKKQNDSTDAGKYNVFDFTTSNYLNYLSDEAYLTRLKGAEFIVRYCSDNDKPINLKTTKNITCRNRISKLYILKDTCTIRKDGSLPGGEILFEGKIGEKRMGAALPFDIGF